MIEQCPATLKTIIKQDGLRGLYRGLGPTILGYLPTWAIYFAVYDGIKTRFGESPLGTTQPRRSIYPAAHPKGYQPNIRDHPWSLHILSAMTAGACSTICTNPLWVIKTRFMVWLHVLRFMILHLKLLTPDPTSNRKQIPSYPRCLHHDIPFRRASRILSRSSPQPAWDSTCCCTISSLRATSCMGPLVLLFTYGFSLF